MRFLKKKLKNDSNSEYNLESESMGSVENLNMNDEVSLSDENNLYTEDVVVNNNPGLEKYSIWVLLVMLFLLPLIFVPSISFPFQFTKTLIIFLGILVSAILFIISKLKEGNILLPINKIIFAMWILPVVYFLSAIFSESPSQSFVGQSFELDTFGFITLLVLLASLVVILMRRKEHILSSYLVLFTSFIVIWVFQGFRLFFGPDFLSLGILTNSTSNILGKWNDLAIFFGLATIMSLVTLASMQLSGTYKKVLYVMLLVSLAFLAVVNFGIVWIIVGIFSLGFFVQSVSSSVFNRKQNDSDEVNIVKSNRTTPVISLIVLVISVVFILWGTPIGTTISSKFNISQIEARPSWQSTINIAQKTYETDLLFGSGPNTFVKQWTKFKGTSVNEIIFWNADFTSGIGVIPTSFITTGIIGGLVWLLVIALFILSGFKTLILRPSKDGFTYFLTLSSFLAGLYLWVVSIIYTPNAVLMALAFFFTGIYIAMLRHNDSGTLKEKLFVFANNPKTGFISVFMLTFLLLVMIVGIFSVGKNYVAAVKFQNGIIALNSEGNIDKAERNVLSASSIRTSDRYYRLLADINVGRISLLSTEEGVSADDLRIRFERYLGDAVKYGQLSTEVDGTNYQNWLALGRVYHSVVPLGIQGAYENAKSSYEKAFLYNPDSPAIYLSLARLEVDNKNILGARDYISLSLSKKSNYTEAIFLLSQIEMSEGNVDRAIASVEQVARLSQNNPVIFFQLGLLKYNEKDNNGAREALERAVGLNNTYANAKYFLGLTYYRLGMNNDAIKQFEEIEVLNPDNEEVKFILKNLRAGDAPFKSDTAVIPPEDRVELPIEEE